MQGYDLPGPACWGALTPVGEQWGCQGCQDPPDSGGSQSQSVAQQVVELDPLCPCRHHESGSTHPLTDKKPPLQWQWSKLREVLPKLGAVWSKLGAFWSKLLPLKFIKARLMVIFALTHRESVRNSQMPKTTFSSLCRGGTTCENIPGVGTAHMHGDVS